jgi:hypothetical protein
MRIEVDRLRVKPIVKVTGEFWAQTTEGDGNFHMFEFLEREGAQIIVEPIGNWIMYLLWQAKENQLKRRGVDERFTRWEIGKKLKYELNLRKKVAMFGAGRTVLQPPVRPRHRGARRHRPPPVADGQARSRSRRPTTTSTRAAARATSRWRRTSTTRSTRRRTWC